jgi:hypothetical protein
MPSEQPNENMDKALKAYAQKRREDSPEIEMDLVTRNMLQAEMKRTLGEVPVPAATRARPRFAWWPQMIIGVASVAALAIAVLFWKLPSRNERSDKVGFASENRSAIPADATVPAPKSQPETTIVNGASADQPSFPTPTPAPAAVASEKPTEEKDLSKNEIVAKRVEPRPDETKKEVPTVTQSSVAATTTAQTSDSQLTADVAAEPSKAGPAIVESPNGGRAALTAVPSTPSVEPVSPSGSVALNTVAPKLSTPASDKAESYTFGRKQDVVQQQQQQQQQKIRFSQINNRSQYRENLNSPPLPKVLLNFGLQRTGSNVVVVDGDGSTYSGNVISKPGNQQAGILAGAAKAPALTDSGLDRKQEAPDDNFAFKVSGYNKRLRAKVVFSGSVSNAAQNVADGLNSEAQTRNAGQNQLAVKSWSQNSQNAQNVLLNGHVQVGRTSEYEIQAAPAAAALK